MKAEIISNCSCYHCGTDVIQNTYELDNKQFCCIGCQSVYQVLSTSNMCNYYVYNDNPGQTPLNSLNHLEYLDEPAIVSKLVDYTDEKVTTLTFYVPSIHCSSCIWLLEHLYKFNPAIVHSRIDLDRKSVV